MKRICDICKKHISSKDNYYKVEEFSNKKVISTKYAHKICHLKTFNAGQNLSGETQKLIRMATGLMQQLGIEEVVKI